MKSSIIQVQNFILATRDSGYKSTAAALAELVDNAIESDASKIHIQIKRESEDDGGQYEVSLVDNGRGMKEDELRLALQFGGSTKFNSRRQLGRYGMGLPNSSLSQCRRVEVITWTNKKNILSSYLDVEEIVDNNYDYLEPVKKISDFPCPVSSKSGTMVIWKKCDRLSFKYYKSLKKHIHLELGRIFRYAIWSGVDIRIDNEKIVAFDPLFMGEGLNQTGGVNYGKELVYEVKVPGLDHKTSAVTVRFVELPISTWARLPNEAKRKMQISKCAGVSIIRFGREIDFGWFFMGDKRKENYDDWWRCEISFHPELDEVFGVTHTKQQIKETEFMCNILVPDIEQTARALNNRVRLSFLELKNNQPEMYAQSKLERTDIYQPALSVLKSVAAASDKVYHARGMHYKIVTKELSNDIFFDVEQEQNAIILAINTTHLFYDKIFKALHDRKINNSSEFIKIMELLMFAAARSELSFKNGEMGRAIRDFKKEWSTQLKTFIS